MSWSDLRPCICRLPSLLFLFLFLFLLSFLFFVRSHFYDFFLSVFSVCISLPLFSLPHRLCLLFRRWKVMVHLFSRLAGCAAACSYCPLVQPQFFPLFLPSPLLSLSSSLLPPLHTRFCLAQTLEGHGSSVLKVGWLHGGLQLVSAGADALIKLWNITTSECMNTFSDQHTDRVRWKTKHDMMIERMRGEERAYPHTSHLWNIKTSECMNIFSNQHSVKVKKRNQARLSDGRENHCVSAPLAWEEQDDREEALRETIIVRLCYLLHVGLFFCVSHLCWWHHSGMCSSRSDLGLVCVCGWYSFHHRRRWLHDSYLVTRKKMKGRRSRNGRQERRAGKCRNCNQRRKKKRRLDHCSERPRRQENTTSCWDRYEKRTNKNRFLFCLSFSISALSFSSCSCPLFASFPLTGVTRQKKKLALNSHYHLLRFSKSRNYRIAFIKRTLLEPRISLWRWNNHVSRSGKRGGGGRRSGRMPKNSWTACKRREGEGGGAQRKRPEILFLSLLACFFLLRSIAVFVWNHVPSWWGMSWLAAQFMMLMLIFSPSTISLFIFNIASSLCHSVSLFVFFPFFVRSQELQSLSSSPSSSSSSSNSISSFLSPTLSSVVSSFTAEECVRCLNYVREWNTNSRTCLTAQRALAVVLTTIPLPALLSLPEVRRLWWRTRRNSKHDRGPIVPQVNCPQLFLFFFLLDLPLFLWFLVFYSFIFCCLLFFVISCDQSVTPCCRTLSDIFNVWNIGKKRAISLTTLFLQWNNSPHFRSLILNPIPCSNNSRSLLQLHHHHHHHHHQQQQQQQEEESEHQQ